LRSVRKRENKKLIKESRAILGENKPILAGSGCEGTIQTIEMTNKMAQAGATAALVITPSYYKSGIKQENLYRHFKKVADFSEIPVILYNVPKFTNVELEVDTIVELSKHENIIGMKESNAGTVENIPEILKRADEDFGIVAGSAGFFLKALDLGGIGCIAALANILPNELCELHDTKDVNLQDSLIHRNNLITAKYGVQV